MTATVARLVVFTLVCVVGAAWLVVSLGNIDLFRDATPYEAELLDATGLTVNDAVKIAGVEVGKVHELRIERGRAIARFTVESDVVLGRETTLRVAWRNVLGLRYLYVQPAGEGQLPEGYRFPADAVEAPADLSAFLERLTPVMRALDPEVSNVVVRALVDILQGREEEIQQLVADAGAFLDAVGQRDEQTRRIIADAARLFDAYAGRAADLRTLVDRFADVSVAVADRNDALVAAIDRVADLNAEWRATVEATDEDLRGSLAELDRIAAVLAVNHDEIEDILAYTSVGIVQYHRISRWGQWFNIRVPGLSSGESTIETERGASLPPRGPRRDTARGAAALLRFAEGTS